MTLPYIYSMITANAYNCKKNFRVHIFVPTLYKLFTQD